MQSTNGPKVTRSHIQNRRFAHPSFMSLSAVIDPALGKAFHLFNHSIEANCGYRNSDD
jgi:hypothetical protein